ncbi:MAG: serine/threonine-protein kinase [Pseudomonadota bacterium]
MGNAQERQIDDESFVDELAPGTELLHGQFTIEKFLNSGGFGITYLARDSLDRRVVIKECFPSSFCHRSRAIVQPRSRAHTTELKSVVDLFVQEARSLAKLEHPNIVGVHQVFEDNATAYMVLDFVEGRDLLDILEEGDQVLTAPQLKGILKDVLGAVGYIHNQDILHRDISPDNILLDADLRPVLIDFGAAREEATKKSRVLSALRVVKDGYSPQEFYVQGSAQTPSSDLYALGATFYHLIEGEVPPNSQARLAAIAAGEEDTYQPLVDRVKGFDKKFLSAIDKSLGILPKDRLQSAQEWLDMMEGNRRMSRVVTPVAPPPSSAAAETVAAEKRNKSKLVPLLGSAAVIAILAVGGLVGTGVIEMPGAETSDPQVAVTLPETNAASASDDVAEAPAASENAAAPEQEVPGPLAEAQQPAASAQTDTTNANQSFLDIIGGGNDSGAPTPTESISQSQTAEQAKAILQAEMEAAQREAELAAAEAAEQAEAQRQIEIAAAEAEAERQAQIAAAEAEARRQLEIVAAEAEAARLAEVAAAEEAARRDAELAAAQAEEEAEAARVAEAAAAQAEAERQAEIAAAEAEAARQAEIAAAEAEAERQAEIAAAEAEAERQAEIAAAEAEAARQAEIAAAEAEAERQAEIAAAEAEAERQAEIAAAEAEAARQAEIAAAEAEAARQAEIAAAEAEAERQAEIAAAEAEAERQAEIAAAEAEAARQAEIAAAEAEATNVGTTNVLSAWSLELPFRGRDDTNVIGDVDIVAPAWASVGTKVVAVNGTPIESIADISTVLRNSAQPADAATQRVSLMLQPEAGGQLTEQTWEFPVVQETALLNGTSFTTRFNGENWTTVVSALPNASGDFQVGDELIALMTTSERIEGRTSLKDIVERELAGGQTEFSFAVSREGSMWVVSMTYNGGV